jgi:hypothetical protein
MTILIDKLAENDQSTVNLQKKTKKRRRNKEKAKVKRLSPLM